MKPAVSACAFAEGRKFGADRVQYIPIGVQIGISVATAKDKSGDLYAQTKDTLAQIDATLAKAGSELVRVTVNNEESARAVPHIVEKLAKQNCHVPVVGDFHYNGHTLLANFPDCAEDRAAFTRSIPADAPHAHFAGLPAGTYAVAVIHDENSNARLDTFAGIPREGIGFSRNPGITFGPPRFSAAGFTIGAAPVRETVRIRYFL